MSHDPAGQLIGRNVSNPAYVFAPATGSTSYANNALNQVTSVGGSPVTTDARGDITGLPGASAYGYDAAGRPSCVVTRMNPAVFGTVTSNACVLGTAAGYGPDRITAFAYDNLGRVTSVATPGGQTLTYGWDGLSYPTFTRVAASGRSSPKARW